LGRAGKRGGFKGKRTKADVWVVRPAWRIVRGEGKRGWSGRVKQRNRLRNPGVAILREGPERKCISRGSEYEKRED